MYIISHRGYLNGPNEDQENNPVHINKIIFDYRKSLLNVEVDLWKIDDKFFLGHDNPKHEINEGFLIKNAEVLWIHCKNVEALEFVASHKQHFIYFWHENDTYTVTSNGIVWNHAHKNTNLKNSIGLFFTIDSLPKELDKTNFFGICTDYPIELQNILSMT